MLLLAILRHLFECVSHFIMRYAGSESDPEVCGSSELLVSVFKVCFFISLSASCPLKAQGKAAWGNHMLRPQLAFEEEGT